MRALSKVALPLDAHVNEPYRKQLLVVPWPTLPCWYVRPTQLLAVRTFEYWHHEMQSSSEKTRSGCSADPWNEVPHSISKLVGLP